MSKQKETPEDWENEFKSIQHNPIYFIEKYWNAFNPDNAVSLSDDEKQELFDQYKGIPLFKDFEGMGRHNEKVKELKEKGLKG